MFRHKLAVLYRATVPEILRRGVRGLINVFDRGGYNKRFFDYIESLQADSFPIMAETIVRVFDPASVIDIGCGSGGLLHELSAYGGIPVSGMEYSEEGRKLCLQKGLTVDFVDLTEPLQINSVHELVVCLEVAEHLPETTSDQLVSSLTSGPERILFSAATPGQGGNGHINEQPNSYWIEKFAAHDFIFDQSLTFEMRNEWQSKAVARWFANNVMVFFKN